MSTDPIAAFVEHGAESGCVEISQLHELVDTNDLGDEEVARLYEQLEEHHVDISDDCGKQEADSTYINGDLDQPERRAALAQGLASIRTVVAGLPELTRRLDTLVADEALAWRWFACTLLAEELLED